MTVKLIAKTIPVSEEYGKTIREFIAYVARVSNPSNQHNHLTANKLLQYLEREGHWSPFEMASLTMEINTTRDIARQILRHRSFSFQEFSQRYATVDGDPILRDCRLQDHKNRQNSIPTDDEMMSTTWNEIQRNTYNIAAHNYRTALEAGIAKEVARALLPEGLTPSRLYMAGTLRSWLHYVNVRTGNGTQREHIEIANQVNDILMKELWEQ